MNEIEVRKIRNLGVEKSKRMANYVPCSYDMHTKTSTMANG